MPASRSALAAASALAVAALAAACGTASRFAGTPGAAVVVFEPGREADAEAARAALTARGWSVYVTPSGPASRTRSSVGIYGQRRRPGRGSDVAEALAPAVGEIEVLPFLAEGPGRHDAVVWLARP